VRPAWPVSAAWLLLLVLAAGCGASRREWTSIGPADAPGSILLTIRRDVTWTRPGELGAASLEWEIEEALERSGFDVLTADRGDVPAAGGLSLSITVTHLPSASPEVMSAVVFEASLSEGDRPVFEKLYGRPGNQGASADASAFEPQNRALRRVARELAQDLVAWCRQGTGAAG